MVVRPHSLLTRRGPFSGRSSFAASPQHRTRWRADARAARRSGRRPTSGCPVRPPGGVNGSARPLIAVTAICCTVCTQGSPPQRRIPFTEVRDRALPDVCRRVQRLSRPSAAPVGHGRFLPRLYATVSGTITSLWPIVLPRHGECCDADKRGVAGSLDRRRNGSHRRSNSRIVSDMVREGGFQSRTMTTSDSTATIHPATDVVPDTYPTAPTARTQAAINAGFT
jgi:hypothetical protein